VNGPVTVIGGANMDINGFSRDPLNMEDSNPGRVEYCPGGVGRNIAENLHRLGAEVRFISVIGDDPGGELIRASSARMGLNIGQSLFLNSAQAVTSVYIALMDSNGEMKLALSDMGILEQMTAEHLESKAAIIEESAVVVLDANLSPEIIRFITDRFSGSGPLFFLDAVSAKKAPGAASRIASFDTIKMGRMEASALTGITLSGNVPLCEKLEEKAIWFINRGVRRVFITLGKEGVFTACADKSFFSPIHYVQPVNSTGGGDAFMAGIVYGTLQDWDEERTVSFSAAMARITVKSKSAVSQEMCLELVQKELQETTFPVRFNCAADSRTKQRL
jgi:pseudouridine kinase